MLALKHLLSVCTVSITTDGVYLVRDQWRGEDLAMKKKPSTVLWREKEKLG